MTHKLMNVEYDKEERVMYRWKGNCRCNLWVGFAPTEKRLKKFFDTHKKEASSTK